jgi:hypothetical protein
LSFILKIALTRTAKLHLYLSAKRSLNRLATLPSRLEYILREGDRFDLDLGHHSFTA